MSKAAPRAKLGDVLRHRKEFITIDDLTTYKRPRVQLHVQGIVQRDEIAGALIKTKTQQVCHTGEFLVAEIDAKVGGFGIVPDSLNGSMVSSHYFLFVVDESKLDRRFLDFFIRTPAFCEQVAAQGSTNYAAIRPSHVLGYEIPLPPLAEQRRVVARIEELATQIHDARTLRQKSAKEVALVMDNQKRQIFSGLAINGFVVRISDADLSLNKESRDPARSKDETFTYVDISAVGPGPRVLASGKKLAREDAPSRARRVIHENDIIISSVRPNLRSFAKVGRELDNQICSTGFSVITCGPSILPDFFLHLVCSPFFVDQCMARVTGGHYPAINDSNLREVEIVSPPLPEQRRIVAELDALQAELDALKRLQAETAAELDALLPAILDKAFKGEL